MGSCGKRKTKSEKRKTKSWKLEAEREEDRGSPFALWATEDRPGFGARDLGKAESAKGKK